MLRDGEEERRYAYGVQRYESESSQETDWHRGQPDVHGGGIFPGYGKSYVNDDYVQAVASAGGVPMILPVTDEEDIVEAQIEAVDGLVISGGWDVDPLLWGEEPHEKLGSTLPVRDTFDRLLIAAARRRGLPILGICRGLSRSARPRS